MCFLKDSNNRLIPKNFIKEFARANLSRGFVPNFANQTLWRGVGGSRIEFYKKQNKPITEEIKKDIIFDNPPPSNMYREDLLRRAFHKPSVVFDLEEITELLRQHQRVESKIY